MKVVSLRADAVEGFFTPEVAGDVLNGHLAHVHPTVGSGVGIFFLTTFPITETMP
jgi:hypothetical protein